MATPAISDAGSHEPLVLGERWFAVQSQCHREAGAAIQLRNQGFRVFLPLRARTCRHARRIDVRLVPFFPGYLFVALDLGRDRWRSVNSTYGVQRLVTSGCESRPMPVPLGIIEALHCEADARGCLMADDGLRVGEPVRILAGPFSDIVGELVQLDEPGRTRLLIELLGAQIPVLLPRVQVVATN